MENILSGNPLINLAGQQQQMNQAQNTFRVKRRYLTNTHILKQFVIAGENISPFFNKLLGLSFCCLIPGGMMMSCSRIAPKEWTKHERRNALSMIRCAQSSTRNLWRNT